jgi:hypothetical protein
VNFTHRAVALAAAVALGLLGSATAAAAQDDTGPDTQACIDAKAAVAVALAARDEAKVPSNLEQQAAITQTNVDRAVAAYHELGDNLAAPTAAERARLQDRRDDPDITAELLASIDARISAIVRVLAMTELRDTAAAVLKTAVDALAEAQAALDAALRVQAGACDEPDPTPNPRPDLDCVDFPLSDGRSSQDVLDETPGKDPHNLDTDGDRIACEPGQDTRPADNDNDGDGDGDDFDQIGTPPAGGVATGGGPA